MSVKDEALQLVKGPVDCQEGQSSFIECSLRGDVGEADRKSVEKSIVLLERETDSAAAFRSALEAATGWRVALVESMNEAFQCVAGSKDHVKVLIVTIGRSCYQALESLHTLKETLAGEGKEFPHILVLSLATQSPAVALAFEKLGAYFLLRAYPEQVVDVVRRLQWQNRTTKSLVTLVIRRRSGHVAAVAVRSGVSERPIQAGPKLRCLLEYLAVHSKTEHTTLMIADALGICRQSVKEYMLRLRQAFNEACEETPITARGDQVFWTRKVLGGYVHGITANVEIEDADCGNSLQTFTEPHTSNVRLAFSTKR